MITSYFLVSYYVSSWHKWKRAGALYGNLTCDTILAFLIQTCVFIQQTNRGAYFSTKVSSSVLSKTGLAKFSPNRFDYIVIHSKCQLLLHLRSATPCS